jgi:SSS family solute:Na+ symporter
MTNQFSHVVLSSADYIIMACYMLVLILMSIYYRKFAQASMDNYFLGGRNLKGWLNGTSYAATCMNADVAPAYCGMTVITGLYICWWYISRFGLALMIGGILFAVFWRRTKIFTSPEFYELRFSGTPAILMRSWVALRSSFIAVVAWTGAGLLGLSKVSEALLGWEKWETFLIVIPVILFYVILSGYMGVVMSDLFQTIIMIAASLILMGKVWADFGGPSGLYDALLNQFGTGVVSWHPPASHELLGVIGVIAWTVGTAIGYGGDVAPMAGAMEGQRLLSCRNAREASKMYIWTEVVLFFMLAVLTLPALGAMVKWPGLHNGTINKELSYGMLLGHYLPTGLLGLALIALFASIMSTVDSNMNFGAQVFINDVYRRSIRPNQSMAHYMRVGKIVMLVIMGLAILVAYHAQNVIDIAVFMLGLSSAELTANWGQWWWWRFNGKARLAASFGGPVIFILNKYFIFKFLIDAGHDTAYWVVLTSIAATCVVWILVSILTKPDTEKQLVEFYKLAHPMGWWQPIARKSGVSSAGYRSILNGLGIALLGTMMAASGIIGFSCLYVARWWIAAIAFSICILMGILFKRFYRNYLSKLNDDSKTKTELVTSV